MQGSKFFSIKLKSVYNGAPEFIDKDRQHQTVTNQVKQVLALHPQPRGAKAILIALAAGTLLVRD